jgi:hypothetical protein
MTPEEKKKLQDQQQALAAEQAEIIRLQQEANKTQPETGVDDDAKIALQPLYPEDPVWKKIVENYKKEFPDAKIEEGNCLRFESTTSATNFFTTQAQEGSPFLATWVVDGNIVDDHFFSCGDGTLYKGSFAEIAQQLEAALETATHPDIQGKISEGLARIKQAMPKEQNPAAEWKSKLQESKSATNAENTEEAANTAPSPFKKTPN